MSLVSPYNIAIIKEGQQQIDNGKNIIYYSTFMTVCTFACRMRFVVLQRCLSNRNFFSDKLRGGSSVAVLTGTHTVLVNTGLPQDRDLIIAGIRFYLQCCCIVANEVDVIPFP